MSTEAGTSGKIDIDKLKHLIVGALTEPRQTWDTFRQSQPDAKSLFLGLTLPLVVGATVVAAILAFILGTQDLMLTGRSFGALLSEIVLGSLLGCIGLALLAGIALWIAQLFGGGGRYEAALAMSTLVAVPALLAGIPGALPWIGWLIQFAGGIYSLVLLYQAIPVFLELESGRRTLHYICTLVLVLVVNMVLGAVFGGLMVGDQERALREALSGNSAASEAGLFGSLDNMARLYESAANDSYEPPDDGELSSGQVERFLGVARDTAARHARYLDEFRLADEQMTEANADEGFGALLGAMRAVSSGMAASSGAFNAEMAAVKESGGNWAEHQWIRERLRRARYEIADEPGQEANRALYQRWQADIDQALEQLLMAGQGQ